MIREPLLSKREQDVEQLNNRNTYKSYQIVNKIQNDSETEEEPIEAEYEEKLHDNLVAEIEQIKSDLTNFTESMNDFSQDMNSEMSNIKDTLKNVEKIVQH